MAVLPLFDCANLFPFTAQYGRSKIAFASHLPAQAARFGAACCNEIRHHGCNGRFKLCIHNSPVTVYKNSYFVLLARARKLR